MTFEGDYSPSAKIWEDQAGFNEHIASFAKAVSAAKGKIKDVDSLKAELGIIGKQCGGCHETFRIKKAT
jgi:cytochrome c556